MDKFHKKIRSNDKKKQSFSVFQADQVFVKKILARNSSAGNHSSNKPPESFRAPAEVPFKWESRPGEPKDPPEELELHRPPRLSVYAPSSPPPPIPRAATRPALARIRVRHFLKKLLGKGNKLGSFKSNNVDHRRHRDDKNLGFSTVSGSSSALSGPATSSKGYNLPLRRSAKVQSLTWGCIKSVF